MKCGNNLTAIVDKGLECQTCGTNSGFIQVTEDNKNKIQFPTHLLEYLDKNNPEYSGFDPNFCNDLDGSKEGICPCGVFTAHLINKKCNLIDTAIVKQPLHPTCQCKSEISPCGHSISHRLTEQCTAQT